jgi:hypothetical protein
VSTGSGYFIAHTGSAPSLGPGFGRSFFGWVLGCVRTDLRDFGNGLRLWLLASSLSGFGGINHIASGTVSAGGSVGAGFWQIRPSPGAAPPNKSFKPNATSRVGLIPALGRTYGS